MTSLTLRIFVFLTLLGSCGTRQESARVLDQRLPSSIYGCYKIAVMSIIESAYLNSPEVERGLSAKKLCLELDRSNPYSSAKINLNLIDSFNQKIFRFELAPSLAQPKGKGSYAFSGPLAQVDWNGEERWSNSKAPIEVVLQAHSLRTQYRIILDAQTK